MRDQIHPRGLIALELASWGLRIHPLHENSKVPVLPEWQNKATTNPVVIKIWWRQANYNIGIATGRADGDLVGRELVGLDFDCKNGKPGLETFKQHAMLGLVDTLLVRTGTGGIHALYWRRPGSGNGQIENSVEEIAPGVDVRGWHGYLVGPGSVVDGKVYAIMRQVDIGELPGALEEKALRGKGAAKKTNGGGAHAAGEGPGEPIGELDRAEAIARVKRYLLEEAPIAIQGAGGDNTTLQVAYWCKDLGVSEGVCLELMLEHWNGRCAPPWDADELGIKVRNAYRYGKRPPGSSSAFEEFEADPNWKYESEKDWKARTATGRAKGKWRAGLDYVGWDEAEIPRRRWVVDDHVPERQVGLFTGEGGTGKSILELMRNVCHVAEQDWLGLRMRQGSTLYLGCEDDEQELQIRLMLIARYYGVKFEDLKRKGLFVWPMADADPVLAYVPNDKSGRVTATDLFKELREFCGDVKPVNVSLDTLSHVFAGNEIVRVEVYGFAMLMRQLARVSGGSVTVLAHPSLAGMASGSGISGSTAWHGAFRFRMFLQGAKKHEDDDQPDTAARVLEFKKNQYGPLGKEIGLRYSGGLFLPTTGATDEERADADDLAENVFMALMNRFAELGVRVAYSHNSPVYAPKRFVREEEAKRQGVGVSALEKAMRRLLDKGLIWLDRPGRKGQEREWLRPK